jgi:hypothetical protein
MFTLIVLTLFFSFYGALALMLLPSILKGIQAALTPKE